PAAVAVRPVGAVDRRSQGFSRRGYGRRRRAVPAASGRRSAVPALLYVQPRQGHSRTRQQAQTTLARCSDMRWAPWAGLMIYSAHGAAVHNARVMRRSRDATAWAWHDTVDGVIQDVIAELGQLPG